MSRPFAIMIAVLLASSMAHAQSAVGPSGLGLTSPLGVPGASAAPGGTGVPLGATEIDPGGLSPMPGACGSATGSGGTFDGGGLTAMSATGCTNGSSQISTTGTASPLSGAGTSFNLNGGTIPLGATEIDNGGLSPLIAFPTSTPNVSASGTSASGMGGASGTTVGSPCVGMSSAAGATGLTAGQAMAPGC